MKPFYNLTRISFNNFKNFIVTNFTNLFRVCAPYVSII